MKRSIVASFCCLLTSIVLSKGVGAAPELPVLVQESDAICIGTVKDVTTHGFISTKIGYQNGQPIFARSESEIATIAVEYSLKGTEHPLTTKVSFSKNAYTSFNRTRFTQLVINERAIFFLTESPDKLSYSLTEPASDGYSKILIGNAKLTDLSSRSTPFRSTLVAVKQGLSDSSKTIRLNCLGRIASVGILLNIKAEKDKDRYGARYRKALEEPLSDNASDPSSLEQFVKTEVLPSVVVLTKDLDTDISNQAFITAGYLQDVEVIPELVKIADRNSDAAFAIDNYRIKDAVRLWQD